MELPLDKPLCRGGVVPSPEGDKVRIGFKYERLVGLCYQCGRIGHEVRYCSAQRDRKQGSLPYGEWLKAGHCRHYGYTNKARRRMRMTKLIKGIRVLHRGRKTSRIIYQLDVTVRKYLHRFLRNQVYLYQFSWLVVVT